MKTRVLLEARRLRENWELALRAKERHGSDAADREEQATFDQLVDFVEANDLNYSEFDPRA